MTCKEIRKEFLLRWVKIHFHVNHMPVILHNQKFIHLENRSLLKNIL